MSSLVQRIGRWVHSLGAAQHRRRRTSNGRLASVDVLEHRQLLTVSYQVLADLNEMEGPGFGAEQLVSAANATYFAGFTAATGRELWITDGSVQGTHIVADITPGPESNTIEQIVTIGDIAFFRVNDYRLTSTDVAGLWRTDGTDSGTHRVLDDDRTPFRDLNNLTVLAGQLYFTASVTTTQRAVFRLDATEDSHPVEITGTRSYYSTSVSASISTTSAAWFLESDTITVVESGSVSARTLPGVGRPFYAGSFETKWALGDSLLFLTDEAVTGVSAWISDGTEAGIFEFQYPVGTLWRSLSVQQDHTFTFLRMNVSNQLELWKSDGSSAGTRLVEFTGSGPAGLETMIAGPSGINYFAEPVAGGKLALWQTDGTADGTKPVSEAADVSLTESAPSVIRNGDSILFQGERGGNQRWFGFDPASHKLTDIASTLLSLSFSSIKSHAVFKNGEGLWTSDGTTPATKFMELRSTTNSSEPHSFKMVAGQIYGLAHDDSGVFVFKSDGTQNGTVPAGTLGQELYATSEKVFVRDSFPGHLLVQTGDGVWKRLEEVAPGVSSAGIRSSAVQGDRLYYTTLVTSSISTSTNATLWVTDGTSNGSHAVISDNGTAPEISGLTPFGTEQLLFVRKTTATTGDIWITDGTQTGTRKIRTLTSGTNLFRDVKIFQAGHRAFFSEVGANNRLQWWSTDGTQQGTFRVPGMDSGDSKVLVELNGFTYFTLRTFDEFGLWKSDGTVAGTFQVMPLVYQSDIQAAAVLNGQLFFAQRRGVETTVGSTVVGDIWVSDGTMAGSRKLLTNLESRDPGIFQGNEVVFNPAFGRMYFLANDGVHGRRLWESDGTDAGTKLFRTSSGEFPPFPTGPMITLNGSIYFSGTTDDVGTELVRLTSDTVEDSPDELAIQEVGSQKLLWREVFGAISYEIQAVPLKAQVSGVRSWTTSTAELSLPDEYRIGAFRYWVRGIGQDGKRGPWNKTPLDVTSGVVPVLYGVPKLTESSTPKLSWANPFGTTATEVWLGNRETNKRIAYSLSQGNRSTFTPPSLLPGRYVLWVRTSGVYGISDWSTAADLIVLASPAPLVTMNVTADRIMTVSWTPVFDATDYEIQINGVGLKKPLVSTTRPAASNWYRLPAPVPGNVYTVWIRALRSGNPHSAWSQIKQTLVRQSPVPQISIPIVSWTTVSQATEYAVVLRNRLTQKEVYRTVTQSNSVDLTGLIVPGYYDISVSSKYADGSATEPIHTAFEVSRPVVSIEPAPLPTVDATPVINWISSIGAASYELVVIRVGAVTSSYSVSGITSSTHRIATALSPGEYRVWVRSHFSDSSRSVWGPGVRLSIGAAPVVQVVGRTLRWNDVRDATRYEVLVQLESTPGRYSDVLRTTGQLTAMIDLATSKGGHYRAWVRAVRDESGTHYTSFWSPLLEFDLA
jgi:ELWxxDGT repeat protein